MEDQQLLNGCISGDKLAWDWLAKQYSRLIYDSIITTSKKIGLPLRNGMLDDIHNDVFVILLKDRRKALRAFGSKNGCTLASYIRAITVNRVIGFQRALISASTATEPFDEITGVFEDAGKYCRRYLFEPEPDEEALAGAILSELNERDREFCRVCFSGNNKPSLIADKLGITVENFYVRKKRLITKLRAIAREKEIY